MCAVPNVADFCSSLISCFPGMLLRYCLSAFKVVPVATIIIIIIIIIIILLFLLLQQPFYISRIYINFVLVFALLCTSQIVFLFLFNFDVLLKLSAVCFPYLISWLCFVCLNCVCWSFSCTWTVFVIGH
jgi:hypothetical protein